MRRVWMALLCCVLLVACSPEVDVYAPEKAIYIVYGVLNPEEAEQFVTVTKVFQVEGDAYAYAATNDLTARGLRVRLKVDNRYLESQLVEVLDSVPSPFGSTTGAYRFETVGPTALEVGKRYELEITKPDDPEFLITAFTDIPTAPVLTFPGPPSYYAPLEQYSFPEIEFADEQSIYFKRGTGSGFEIRIYIQYEAQGQSRVSHWGPTAVFKRPVGCDVNARDGCYEIPPRSVSNVLHTILAAYPDTVTFIDTLRNTRSLDSLNRTAWVEVTAVDSFLTTYMLVNSPFGYGQNFLMDKLEYSNISGENAGIFGSINMHRRFIFLGPCTKFLAGMRQADPGNCLP